LDESYEVLFEKCDISNTTPTLATKFANATSTKLTNQQQQQLLPQQLTKATTINNNQSGFSNEASLDLLSQTSPNLLNNLNNNNNNNNNNELRKKIATPIMQRKNLNTIEESKNKESNNLNNNLNNNNADNNLNNVAFNDSLSFASVMLDQYNYSNDNNKQFNLLDNAKNATINLDIEVFNQNKKNIALFNNFEEFENRFKNLSEFIENKLQENFAVNNLNSNNNEEQIEVATFENEMNNNNYKSLATITPTTNRSKINTPVEITSRATTAPTVENKNNISGNNNISNTSSNVSKFQYQPGEHFKSTVQAEILLLVEHSGVDETSAWIEWALANCCGVGFGIFCQSSINASMNAVYDFSNTTQSMPTNVFLNNVRERLLAIDLKLKPVLNAKSSVYSWGKLESRILITLLLIKVNVQLNLKNDAGMSINLLENLTALLNENRSNSIDSMLYVALLHRYKTDFEEWSLSKLLTNEQILNYYVNRILPLAKKYLVSTLGLNDVQLKRDAYKRLINLYTSIHNIPIEQQFLSNKNNKRMTQKIKNSKKILRQQSKSMIELSNNSIVLSVDENSSNENNNNEFINNNSRSIDSGDTNNNTNSLNENNSNILQTSSTEEEVNNEVGEELDLNIFDEETIEKFETSDVNWVRKFSRLRAIALMKKMKNLTN
jgi:hypothetical protein